MDESPGVRVAAEEAEESRSPAQAVNVRRARTPTAALTAIITRYPQMDFIS
jgi:hypothetical protein